MTISSQKIGDFAKVVSGYAFKSKDFVDHGIPVLKIANIQHEHVVFDKVQYLPPEFLSVADRYHVRNGDVMMSLTGSHVSQPNSVVGRIARYYYNAPALLNQRAARIVIQDSAALDQGFLYYFLRQERVTYQLAINASGSANQANISPKDVEDVPLPNIGIIEQKHIASILSAYDDLIKNNRRRIVLLEEAARLLYREWFVHFRFPGHEHVKIVDGVPDGWTNTPMVDLVEMVMGQSPKSDFYNDYGEGFPFHQGVTNYGFRFVSDVTYSTKTTKIAEPDDILFSVRAPVGRINLTLNKVILGRGLAAFRSKSGKQSFLLYQLKSHFFKEDLIGGGSIYASTSKKELEKLEILQPTDDLVQTFEQFSVPIDDQIRVLTLKTVQLIKSRDLLLPRLMDGRLEV